MKKRVVHLALVIFALWPLAHRALVFTYDVDPWKLGGWAMFTAPTPMIAVALYHIEGTSAEPIAGSSLRPRIWAEVQRFVARRGALGRLASPDDLGRALFEEHPEFRWVAVFADVRKLDPETALILRTTEKHLYEAGRPVELPPPTAPDAR